MRDFKGKIVFVTGGASGAGLGQAKVFGREGMKVAIADVRADALENAKKAEERRKMFEEMAKKNGGNGAPPPMMRRQSAEGTEPFGKARDDLDWIDPSKKLQK